MVQKMNPAKKSRGNLGRIEARGLFINRGWRRQLRLVATEEADHLVDLLVEGFVFPDVGLDGADAVVGLA